ncbi:hypothetical protein CYY_003145 [Polysphondylium violaceum]|uniref:Phosphoserine aminotransferase n=1 Tax=Polysphondylium violaceum TaxID=133409 RepID=A0A8J4PZ07_9MYCE|nr:hypothetical protein CYY_003145 [Polysphondylium violaceum]
MNRAHNFGAGPGSVPDEVLEQVQKELLDYKGTGKSIMEMSHRGKEFTQVIEEAKADLIKLLAIPDEYDVLFLQGGASALFGGIPMNLCNEQTDTVDFIVTGTWSKTACADSKYFCSPNKVVDMESQKFLTVIPPEQWKFSESPTYVHYCDNETVHGIEMPTDVYKHFPKSALVVCDMSSNFLSRPVDVSKFDLIFAGAQKNAGISGITIVIIKKSLLSKTKPSVPTVFNFLKKSQSNSLDNTPPTFNIYVSGLIFKWILKNGGVEGMEKLRVEKSSKLYDFIDQSNGFYKCFIDKDYRSKMNACFRILDGNQELEDKFAKQALEQKITDIKGHRSVGGLRVSLYNAIKVESVDVLISFMEKFMKENSK